jgi:adenylosuccinate synthase
MMKPGKVDVIVGLDYGDEGKGRFTDIKLESGIYTVVDRFNGGNNAGHTLFINGKKVILNSIPSGVFYPNVINYIGSGCVVDPLHILNDEIPKVQEHVSLDGRFKISALATAITPVHVFWDRLTGAMIGTTGKGIGPAYADKAKRAEGDKIRSLRIGDVLANPMKAREIMLGNFEELLEILKYTGNKEALSKYCRSLGFQGEFVMNNLMELVNLADLNSKVRPRIDEFIDATRKLDQMGFIEKDSLWITKMLENGKNVLMEGAQAFGIDVTYGTVPFQTSSSTVEGNAFVGGDAPSKYHGEVIGITKAIASRVGAGPFVGEYGGRESEKYCDEKDSNGKPKYKEEAETQMYSMEELLNSRDPMKFGIALRRLTGEYGATTKRPRRIGMPDLFRLSQAARRSGVDKLYITKTDCLAEYAGKPIFEGQIPMITGYKLNGKEIDYVPFNADELYQVEPQVEFTPAFGDISKIRIAKDLPEEVLKFVNRVQEMTRCKVAGIGVGPGRDELVNL